jgi:hypothetical protein
MIDFDVVEEVLVDAKAIAFDTCHKIYVLMDDNQVEVMRAYGYDILFTKEDMTDYEMLSTIKEWYNDSCSLRFVESVATVSGDANEGFNTLIEQGADWNDKEDDD